MASCAVRWCKNNLRKVQKKDGITFHRFPSNKSMHQKWTEIIRKQRSDPDWSPSRHSRVCSQHFDEKSKYTTRKGIAKLNSTAVPVLKMTRKDAQSVRPSVPTKAPETFPWQDSDSSDQEVTNVELVPLVSLEQCRFCGDFSKNCLYIDNKPYVHNNKTEFTLNGICVNLDFSNDHLPKTVCRDCDVKLQELADFVNVVKAAQDSLINVTDEDGIQEDEINSKDIDEENTIDVKIEDESPTHEQVNENDVVVRVDDTNEAELIKVAEDTIKSFNNKRKVKVADRNLKKAKGTKRQKNEDSLDNEVNNDEKLDFIVKDTIEIGSTRIQKPKVCRDEKNELYIEIDVKKEVIESSDICDVEEYDVSNKKDLT
ncbi:THAP domain-containing protein 5-like [Cydia amplana]|uniref:THAP domain-containing protein 5-like n=1 Tax=Cydia amplana TaxID=1869771 RepID=UPI002FE608BA